MDGWLVFVNLTGLANTFLLNRVPYSYIESDALSSIYYTAPKL